MTSAAPPLEATGFATRDVARIWARHLLSLYIPLNSLAFLWTGPHPWWVAPLFMVPMALAHQIDCSARREQRQPAAEIPAWPFDVLVYALAGLQFWIVIETVRLYTVQGIFSLDSVMVFLLVGGSSGFSIITAHELIHRNDRWEQGLGRLLLCTVLYEHFFTEHLRGHHVRVGTADDPATARFGEGFAGFFRRTVPAQFRSAWRLETRRLGAPEMKLWDRRQLGNRVLHGLALEWGMALAIWAVFGLPAFVAFVLQAYSAVRLLEAVNYFEHWGLMRSGRRVRPVDSWDTHSWFTYYGLIGLSRHADHHSWPTRPYQKLRVWDEAPLLPYGYVGMVDLVLERNAEFQRLATEELSRRGLGPFRPEGEGAERTAPGAVTPEAALQRLEAAQQEERRQAPPGPLARLWVALPVWLRGTVVVATLVLAATVGVQWQTGAAEMGFAARAVLNGWILGVFVGVFLLRGRLEEKWGQEALSWALGFGLPLVVVGSLTEASLGTLTG